MAVIHLIRSIDHTGRPFFLARSADISPLGQHFYLNFVQNLHQVDKCWSKQYLWIYITNVNNNGAGRGGGEGLCDMNNRAKQNELIILELNSFLQIVHDFMNINLKGFIQNYKLL